MKATLSGSLMVLAAAAAFGQTPTQKLEFEVASIRAAGPIVAAADASKVGIHIDGQRVNITGLSLNDYLGIAYKIKLHQISGPEWMASQRFDINAKLPADAKGEQIPEMLQGLLVDRFSMKFHREMRDFPVYALLVGKNGLKMKESPADPPAADGAPPKAFNMTTSGSNTGTTINYGNGTYISFGNNAFEGKKMPGSAMADILSRFVDRPVVDMTDLKGNYDFTLTFSPEDFRAMMIRSAVAAGVNLPPEALKLLDGANGDSLFSALETVGLKLEQRKSPIDVLVIDHIEKSPTDN
jgi:uncharacterized protein (TIGR03435 family)